MSRDYLIRLRDMLASATRARAYATGIPDAATLASNQQILDAVMFNRVATELPGLIERLREIIASEDLRRYGWPVTSNRCGTDSRPVPIRFRCTSGSVRSLRNAWPPIGLPGSLERGDEQQWDGDRSGRRSWQPWLLQHRRPLARAP